MKHVYAINACMVCTCCCARHLFAHGCRFVKIISGATFIAYIAQFARSVSHRVVHGSSCRLGPAPYKSRPVRVGHEWNVSLDGYEKWLPWHALASERGASTDRHLSSLSIPFVRPHRRERKIAHSIACIYYIRSRHSMFRRKFAQSSMLINYSAKYLS